MEALYICIIAVVVLVVYNFYMWRYTKSITKTDQSVDKISFRETLDLTKLPIVTFMVDNIKYNFMLDSGANLSVIDSNILEHINHKELPKKGIIYGMDGVPQKIPYVSIALEYKGKAYSEEFQVVNMKSAFGRIKIESGATLHGILGNEFFQRFKYVLDFDELVAYPKK